MDNIRFDKVGLVELLLAILFLGAGACGIIYDAYCDAIVFDRYYVVCFGTSICCCTMAIICAILDVLFND